MEEDFARTAMSPNPNDPPDEVADFADEVGSGVSSKPFFEPEPTGTSSKDGAEEICS